VFRQVETEDICKIIIVQYNRSIERGYCKSAQKLSVKSFLFFCENSDMGIDKEGK
jgi:hypothetical protein